MIIFSRLILLLTILLIGFTIGLLVSNLAEWEKFITPIVISVSILSATFFAIQNIKQNRNHEILKRTLDFLDKSPDYSQNFVETKVKINNFITQYRLFENPNDIKLLGKSLSELTDEHAKVALDWLSYYDSLARGLRIGIYDKKLVDDHVGSVPIAVWQDFWPFVNWQRNTTSKIYSNIEMNDEPVFTALENWVRELTNDNLESLIEPKVEYRALHKAGK